MPRPDEGLIHAWLDGQLPPDEAARIEELAATDPEWAAAVAEARGLVAASSRILSALDHVPAGVVPKRTALRTTRLPWWTKIAAAVVVVAGGSVVVMQSAPAWRISVPSTEEGAAQPTPDTSKVVVQVPVTSPPGPATATPGATARTPSPAAGALAGASTGKGDVPAVRREALAASPVIPPSAPVPSASTIVAEERKAMQDAVNTVAEVSAAKSLVAKAAPSALQSVAPRAAPQAQQASTQDLAQAQNAVPAQRVAGGVVAALSAQVQQVPQGQQGRERQERPQATLCYRLVPDNLRAGTAILMRAERAVGDTLFLAPVEPNAPQRAWLILRDGMRGVMTTGGDLRSATRITGTPAICPVP